MAEWRARRRAGARQTLYQEECLRLLMTVQAAAGAVAGWKGRGASQELRGGPGARVEASLPPPPPPPPAPAAVHDVFDVRRARRVAGERDPQDAASARLRRLSTVFDMGAPRARIAAVDAAFPPGGLRRRGRVGGRVRVALAGSPQRGDGNAPPAPLAPPAISRRTCALVPPRGRVEFGSVRIREESLPFRLGACGQALGRPAARRRSWRAL